MINFQRLLQINALEEMYRTSNKDSAEPIGKL